MKLQIDPSQVASYLGFGRKALDQETQAQVDWAVEQLQLVARPRTSYQRFTLEKAETIQLTGTSFQLVGEDVKSLLADCDSCILLAVTLGQQVDGLIRRLSVTQLERSVVLDFCASSMVENLCDQLEEELHIRYTDKEHWFTDRYSPGYGDLPLACQREFCRLLNTERRMGLTVSASGILLPRKSVTAVIGIANRPQKSKIRGCSHCDLSADCPYRREGSSCEASDI